MEHEQPESITSLAGIDTPIDQMRRAASRVMAVEDTTISYENFALRLRGKLLLPSEEAFAQLRPAFEAAGHTPMLRREDGRDVILALPGVFSKPERKTPWGAIIAFAITVLSVLWIGIASELYLPLGEAVRYRLTGTTLAEYAPDVLPTAEQWRAALVKGALYALSLLGILGAHEMGHYIVSRRRGVHTTFPFFIPMPFSILGTMGAVIARKEPAPNKKTQFDIGIAGPLAGLVIAIPLLVIGLSLSEVSTRADILAEVPASVRQEVVFSQEGQSLLYAATKLMLFGEILPMGERDVFLHPIAFAAWAGLLVTALNLIPVGQLDGGHVLYGLFGDKAEKLRRPILAAMIALALLGTLDETGILPNAIGWSGSWFWVALLVLLVRVHAPVLDEITELDPRRRALGVVMLVVFILLFTPQPLVLSPALIGLF